MKTMTKKIGGLEFKGASGCWVAEIKCQRMTLMQSRSGWSVTIGGKTIAAGASRADDAVSYAMSQL